MFEIKYVGQTREPVVIMDDFHPSVNQLCAVAQIQSFEPLSEFYPGVQAPADPKYLQPVAERLTQAFKTVFAVQQGVSLIQCCYSLVTIKDPDLKPIQRSPHVDTTDPGRFALLHYLGREDQGGTAFYRQRRTGLEVLSDENYDAYKGALEAYGLPKAGYMRGSDDRFEMIAHFQARPNRAILYRSALLHSGFIPEEAVLSSDPSIGRLTLNSFFQEKSKF